MTAATLEPGTYYMYVVVSETENYNVYTTAPAVFTVKAADLKDAKVVLEKSIYTYDGKEKKPDVSVIIGKRTLAEGVDYTVAFAGIKSTSTKKVTISTTVTYGGKTLKITSVADIALNGKTKVTSVTIGSNVTKIGKNAFNGCKSLKTITIQSTTLKTVESNAFKGIYSKTTIKVPTNKYASYKKLLAGKGQDRKVSTVINAKKGDTFTSNV